jgi:hypothetical protein
MKAKTKVYITERKKWRRTAVTTTPASNVVGGGNTDSPKIIAPIKRNTVQGVPPVTRG